MLHCVYKHTFPNGKVYIGQTHSGMTQERWRGGKGYCGQQVFDAIIEYGWNNVKSEILEDDIPSEKINEEEAYYIKKYHATDKRYGYNVQNPHAQSNGFTVCIDGEIYGAEKPKKEPVPIERPTSRESDCPYMMKLKPASKKFGISYDRLRKMCLAGEVANIRTGRDWLINTSSLTEILQREATA